jgi:hypothetical protein
VVLTHPAEGLSVSPLDELRRELTKKIRRDVNKHARRSDYPTYWLALYANFSHEAYKVPPDYAAKVVAEALIAETTHQQP